MRRFLLVTVVLSLAGIGAVRQTAPFTLQEVMIPVRDGARLQTVILTPTDRSGPLPSCSAGHLRRARAAVRASSGEHQGAGG